MRAGLGEDRELLGVRGRLRQLICRHRRRGAGNRKQHQRGAQRAREEIPHVSVPFLPGFGAKPVCAVMIQSPQRDWHYECGCTERAGLLVPAPSSGAEGAFSTRASSGGLAAPPPAVGAGGFSRRVSSAAGEPSSAPPPASSPGDAGATVAAGASGSADGAASLRPGGATSAVIVNATSNGSICSLRGSGRGRWPLCAARITRDRISAGNVRP